MHNTRSCLLKSNEEQHQQTEEQAPVHQQNSKNDSKKGKAGEEQWKIVTFPKNKKSNKRQSNNARKVNPGINVNLFDAASSKYPDSKTFTYKN